MKKKILQAFTVICICILSLGTVPVSAETYGDFEYSLATDSEISITAYNGSATEIIIPSQIDGKTVVRIDVGVLAIRDTIKKVTIPESVYAIGFDAFLNCKNLEKIIVNENNNWYSSDSFGALYDKDKKILIQYPIGNNSKEFTIPNGITSIQNQAFYGCERLESITIPDSITDIGCRAFGECYNLKKVNITNLSAWCNINFEYNSYFFDFESEKEKSNPLCYGANLYINGNLAKNITILNDVMSIGNYTFYNCSSLTSVTIPDSVISIGDNACYDCLNLEKIYYKGTEED